MTAPFASALLGWKTSDKNKLNWGRVPNNSDVDSVESLRISAALLDEMPSIASPVPQKPGPRLESLVCDDLAQEIPKADPNRIWKIRRGGLVSHFSQYSHLDKVDKIVEENPELEIALGREYLIRPDVTVAIADKSLTGPAFLHAAVSCKWTIRSDRVQNVRHEFGQLVRHRRARQPHLVAITAEPLPTRLRSIARGTGEVDSIYHIAYPELQKAVDKIANEEQSRAWKECTGQGRVLPYSSLSGTLVRW